MTQEIFIWMGLFIAVAAVEAQGGGSQEVGAQESAKTPPTEITDGDVERMNEAMTPGPMHQLLARLEGDWKYESTLWSAPGAPPTQVGGEAKKRMILGGRFLDEVHTGSYLGMTAEGRNTTGWDNLAEQFVGVWVDNSTTGMIVTRGQVEADGQTIALESEFLNPMNDRREKLRLIYRIQDADHHSFEYWVKGTKGQPDHKHMEIRYTRKGKS